MSLDIDALMQNSYLLVVELRQGASARQGSELWAFCASQVETVRHALEEADLAQRNIDHISHAQCALLDETVLGCVDADAHAAWASEPLQARFFNRHQAGETLYEDMREVLREPSPDPYVLTVFQRVLMLGFQGRCRNASDPERKQLLAALDERVAPMDIRHPLVTQVGRRRPDPCARLQSPLVQVLAATLLVCGIWWALDHTLSEMVAALMQDKA
nr:type VI secretion system protein TssL, short form [Pseudomonas fluorescens]